MAETTIPTGLAKVAGRHRCGHSMRPYAGQRTGTLQSSWGGLLNDLKKFGESFKQPKGKGAKAMRQG